jgi:hypothetical protein
VKKLIQNLRATTEENKNVLEEALEPLLQNIENNLDFYLNSKGIFIIIAILENSDFSEKLKQLLQHSKNIINSIPQNSGVTLLKELVFN